MQIKTLIKETLASSNCRLIMVPLKDSITKPKASVAERVDLSLQKTIS